MGFDQLYETSLIDEPGCWKTCNGGFCCSNNHPDFDFRFMATNGVEILYLPREYHWAQQNRRTFNNQQGKAVSAIQLDVGEFGIGVIYNKCTLLGRCDGVVDKPLLCRLYPFLPKYGYDGTLEDIFSASVFDITFAVRNEASPCTVSVEKNYFRKFSEASTATLFDTYVKFYLRCAYHFSKLMSEGLRKSHDLQQKSGKDFWRHWERAHLSGQFIDKEALKDLVRKEYKMAQAHDPSFDLSGEKSLIAEIRHL